MAEASGAACHILNAKNSSRVVFERMSIRLAGRSERHSSSFEAASERRRSNACRPLHYDKPGSRKMVHKSAGDLGHDLVRVVDAPAALISQCEGEGGGKVGGVGCREGLGRAGHGFRVAQRLEQDKNGFARPGGCS